MRTLSLFVTLSLVLGCDAANPNTNIPLQGRYTLSVDGGETQSGRARGDIGNNGIPVEGYRVLSDAGTVDVPEVGDQNVLIGFHSLPGVVGRYGIAPHEAPRPCTGTTTRNGPGAEALLFLYAVVPDLAPQPCDPFVLGGTVDVRAAGDDDVQLDFEIVALAGVEMRVGITDAAPDTVRIAGTLVLGAAAR